MISFDGELGEKPAQKCPRLGHVHAGGYAEALDLQVHFRQLHPFDEGKIREPDSVKEVPGRIDDNEFPFHEAGVGIEFSGPDFLPAALGFDPLQPLDPSLGVVFDEYRFNGRGRPGRYQQGADLWL